MIADEIVSKSRISPTRITSGSSRSAARSAALKDIVSIPTSRWLIMDALWKCSYSIGSSIVIICSARSVLIISISDANVVDLPLPVGPVTKTSPRFFLVSSTTDGGSPKDSALGISVLIKRITVPNAPFCLSTFTRNRPFPGMACEKSASPVSSSDARSRSGTIGMINSAVSAADNGSLVIFLNSPCTRHFASAPAATWRSDAPILRACASRSLIVKLNMSVPPFCA